MRNLKFVYDFHLPSQYFAGWKCARLGTARARDTLKGSPVRFPSISIASSARTNKHTKLDKMSMVRVDTDVSACVGSCRC